MKKRMVISIATLLFAIGMLSACNSSTVDRSYLTQEAKENEETLLKTAKEEYAKATTEEEKSNSAFEIGFRYMNLGEYGKAIEYYGEVLEYDANHYPVLTNMAVMYEELGDVKTALKYEKQLYDNNPTNTEVVSDIIRLLVANEQFNNAQGVLENFARSEESKNNTEFISDQYSYILSRKDKTQK